MQLHLLSLIYSY